MNTETKTNNETTALAVGTRNNMTALQLCGNMQSVNALGQTLAQSGFFGRVSASTATAALVNCFLEGLTPLQYKAKYHTFDNGQTGIKSDYIQREFHRMGGKWKFNRWDAEVCDMSFTYQGETLDFKVTLKEFKDNGVAMSGGKVKDNWAKFPREMLKARCMSTAIRAICPEALEGMYSQEEVADFSQAPAAPATPAPAAKVEAVSASPIANMTEVELEAYYSVCPCGSVKGKRWEDLPNETLEKILATPANKAKGLTAEHRNAIIAELSKREEAVAESIEVEVVEDI